MVCLIKADERLHTWNLVNVCREFFIPTPSFPTMDIALVDLCRPTGSPEKKENGREHFLCGRYQSEIWHEHGAEYASFSSTDISYLFPEIWQSLYFAFA